MENGKTVKVEVAYALPEQQTLIAIEIESGSTAEEAIRRSGILDKHPEIQISTAKVGIFGKVVKIDTPIQAGDRVEIYRELIADPKEMRRQRAAEKSEQAAKAAKKIVEG